MEPWRILIYLRPLLDSFYPMQTHGFKKFLFTYSLLYIHISNPFKSTTKKAENQLFEELICINTAANTVTISQNFLKVKNGY